MLNYNNSAQALKSTAYHQHNKHRSKQKGSPKREPLQVFLMIFYRSNHQTKHHNAVFRVKIPEQLRNQPVVAPVNHAG